MEVQREIVVPAPVEEVWSALTEPDRLEEWFANDRDDGEERHAVIEEVVPERRFAFTWDESRVEIELAEVAAGTRVLVTETAGAGWSVALSLYAVALASLSLAA